MIYTLSTTFFKFLNSSKFILLMIFLKFLGHIQDMKDLILRKIPD